VNDGLMGGPDPAPREHPETWHEARLRRFYAFIEKLRQERAALAPGELPGRYFTRAGR
jgi:hypothetical protein